MRSSPRVKEASTVEAVRRSSRKGAGHNPTRDAQYALEEVEDPAGNSDKFRPSRTKLEGEVSSEEGDDWHPEQKKEVKHQRQAGTRQRKTKEEESDEEFVGDMYEMSGVRRSSRRGKGNRMAENIEQLSIAEDQ